MPEISFIMNTNRNFDFYGSKVVESIKNLTNKRSYEILVFSKADPKYPGVTWVEEKYDTGGSIYGYNLLASMAKGDFICIVVDDYILSPNYLDIITYLEDDYFENKKFRITTPGIKVGNSFCPGEFPTKTFNNYANGEFITIDNETHILKFPTFHRSILQYLDNYIFHPDFIHHAADNYLAWYIMNRGEPTKQFDGVYVDCFSHMNGCPKFDQHDNDVLWWLMKENNEKYIMNDIGLCSPNPKELIEKYQRKSKNV